MKGNFIERLNFLLASEVFCKKKREVDEHKQNLYVTDVDCHTPPTQTPTLANPIQHPHTPTIASQINTKLSPPSHTLSKPEGSVLFVNLTFFWLAWAWRLILEMEQHVIAINVLYHQCVKVSRALIMKMESTNLRAHFKMHSSINRVKKSLMWRKMHFEEKIITQLDIHVWSKSHKHPHPLHAATFSCWAQVPALHQQPDCWWQQPATTLCHCHWGYEGCLHAWRKGPGRDSHHPCLHHSQKGPCK